MVLEKIPEPCPDQEWQYRGTGQKSPHQQLPKNRRALWRGAQIKLSS
jgi:hypothetical protein